MSDPLPTIYVGPTSTKLGLTQFSMYQQLSEVVQKARNDNPALGILLLPLDVFQVMKGDIYGGTSASVQHAVAQLQADGVL